MRSDPTILAFDTSAAHCAAALLLGGKIVATQHEEMKKGQAERLFPMFDEVMKDFGAVWEELDVIAVGIGPGNFTGVRIAVSAARGLSLSLGIPAVGVSGFEALLGARGLQNPAPIIVSLPSSRGWFLQKFLKGRPQGQPIGAHRTEGYSDDDLSRFLNTPVYGYDAAKFEDLTGLSDAYEVGEFHNADGLRIAERIANVCATRVADACPTRRPSPLYIRPADAAPSSELPPVILP